MTEWIGPAAWTHTQTDPRWAENARRTRSAASRPVGAS